VFVRPFPNTATSLHQVSSGNGRQPRWSPDGKEIFFRTFSDTLMGVPVNPGAGFSLGAEHAVLSLRGVTTWDAAPDGKRFLLVRDPDAGAAKRLIVIENFHEELKAKVPR
jgi:dipeptidyl aminopeptidase/acylaminoacyl peptidase